MAHATVPPTNPDQSCRLLPVQTQGRHRAPDDCRRCAWCMSELTAREGLPSVASMRRLHHTHSSTAPISGLAVRPGS
jgi:hypothetical protein